MMAQRTVHLVGPSEHVLALLWIIFFSLLIGIVGAYLIDWFTFSLAKGAFDPAPSGKNGVQVNRVELGRDDSDTDVDIVAIHGLDTTSPETWTWKNPRQPQNKDRWVNWLCPGMLPESVPRAQIYTCDWPAKLFLPSDLRQKTLDEYALLLLDGIHRKLVVRGDAKRKDRPIMFVASCLGGIALMKALVAADGNEYHHLRRRTKGIVFLATPFQGTSFNDVAALAEPGLSVLAAIRGRTVSNLLHSVKGPTFDLDDLVRKFTQLCQDKDQPCEVFSFYELQNTSLPSKVFPWLPAFLRQAKPLVDRSSANLQIVPNPLPLDRCHSLMNKFQGRDCADYVKVAGKIEEMTEKIRAGSPLQQADSWLHNEHYKDRLQIERLSGELLPMEQCYINLALVKQRNLDAGRQDQPDTDSSPFSLFARQKVETPNESSQVSLPTIFDQRQNRDGHMTQPKRIFIKGRAGVGKTTLCKKIVHDFVYKDMWKAKFDRLLWLPLRRLKRHWDRPCTLHSLFLDEYFSHCGSNGQRFADALRDESYRENGSTLFLLDGLDEVSGVWAREDNEFRLLETLLNQPNVIITSRPSSSLPASVHSIDLKLETIGFYPDQVQEYIKADPKIQSKAEDIQSFLQKHWLIQGLVRIPIQLDALCYTWDDARPEEIPNTMTGMYNIIVQKLWKKDAVRLSKVKSASDHEPDIIERLVQSEVYLLEALAFTGMYSNVIDFTSKQRTALYKAFDLQDSYLHMKDVSFLRTSDLSSRVKDRDYHFLHLTFQEYFAARYFVRHWISQENLKCLCFQNMEATSVRPIQLLSKHKYSARYNVFWRFVTGLIDCENDDSILRYFKEIDQEPLDLLGSAHQSLIMHCMNEVARDLPIRMDINKRLAKWVVFECRIGQLSTLPADEEFPDEALKIALQESDARIGILRALEKRTTISKDIIASVVPCLKDGNTYIRNSATNVLCKHSIQSESILTSLSARLLKDGDKYLRKAIGEILGSQPTLPNEVLASLAAQLEENKDQDLRKTAARALSTQILLPKEILASLAERIVGNDKDIRIAASTAISCQSVLPEEVLTSLAARLTEDPNPRNREALARALGRRPSLPNEILTILALRLEDENQSVQLAAAGALRLQSNLPEGILNRLVARLLNDDNEGFRDAASITLHYQSVLPRDILKILIARLTEDRGFISRGSIIEALGRWSSLPEEVISSLASWLRYCDLDALRAAGRVLSSQNSLPKEIIASLVKRLEDDYEEARESAIKALGGHSTLPDDILASLVGQLEDSSKLIKRAATEVLIAQSNLPDGVLATLAAKLEDDNKRTQCLIIEALGRHPGLPQAIIATIAGRLDDDNRFVRAAAADALGKQSGLPTNVLYSLAALLEHNNTSVQKVFVEALRLQPSLPSEIITILAARLDVDDALLRAVAVRAFDFQSTLPREVVNNLAARLGDDDEGVQYAALGALLGREEFLFDLLGSTHLNRFYKMALQHNFDSRNSWYIDGDHLHINMWEKKLDIPLQMHGVDMRKRINAARPLDMPPVCGLS